MMTQSPSKENQGLTKNKTSSALLGGKTSRKTAPKLQFVEEPARPRNPYKSEVAAHRQRPDSGLS
jgi:hypothetical protein